MIKFLWDNEKISSKRKKIQKYNNVKVYVFSLSGNITIPSSFSISEISLNIYVPVGLRKIMIIFEHLQCIPVYSEFLCLFQNLPRGTPNTSEWRTWTQSHTVMWLSKIVILNFDFRVGDYIRDCMLWEVRTQKVPSSVVRDPCFRALFRILINVPRNFYL